MQNPKETIHFILGQTAVGKTNMVADLARASQGAIINCDSRQIYKGLNIITGKIDNPTDLKVLCTEIVTPGEIFSAYDYSIFAINEIENLVSSNVAPFVVGGSGMYAYLLKNIDPGQKILAKKSNVAIHNISLEELQSEIQTKYPFIWERLNPSDRQNSRRLINAIERMITGSASPIDTKSPNTLANRYKVVEKVLLHKDPTTLELRIRERVSKRLENGAIGECQSLLKEDYSLEDPGLNTIGYKSVFKYIAGEMSYDQMIEDWVLKEKQYAKRQKTYFLKYFPDAEIIYT